VDDTSPAQPDQQDPWPNLCVVDPTEPLAGEPGEDVSVAHQAKILALAALGWNTVLLVGGLRATWFGSPSPGLLEWSVVMFGLVLGIGVGHVAAWKARQSGEVRLARACLVADYALAVTFIAAIITLIIWITVVWDDLAIALLT